MKLLFFLLSSSQRCRIRQLESSTSSPPPPHCRRQAIPVRIASRLYFPDRVATNQSFFLPKKRNFHFTSLPLAFLKAAVDQRQSWMPAPTAAETAATAAAAFAGTHARTHARSFDKHSLSLPAALAQKKNRCLAKGHSLGSLSLPRQGWQEEILLRVMCNTPLFSPVSTYDLSLTQISLPRQQRY